MKKDKRARLEKAGWRIGSSEDFLGLSDAESALVDIRMALANILRKARLERHVSQAALAERLGSSQSRVAKMEAGDSSVSVDLLVRSLIMTGSTSAEIGRAISAAPAARSRPARKTA
jgi:ribosome-binding protein aMBF1 (putative translation factor)